MSICVSIRSVAEGNRVTVAQVSARAIEEALVAYSANPVVRAVLAAIPLVSGLDAIAGTAGTNIALERLRVLVEELAANLANVGAAADAAVTADELIDASIRAARGAIETASREKVRTLAAALIGSASRDRPSGLDAESVLASLVSLTPADLVFARNFTSQRAPFTEPNHLSPDAQFRMMRLQGAGLLESIPPPFDWDKAEKATYQMTPTFWRLLELLRAGGETIA